MKLKRDRGRFISDYDQCNVFLISAFYCLAGKDAADARLRKAIQGALVDLAKAKRGGTPSNIVQFQRTPTRTVQ
ncbi:hypothetical protein [Bosea thiooxidans]